MVMTFSMSDTRASQRRFTRPDATFAHAYGVSAVAGDAPGHQEASVLAAVTPSLVRPHH